MLNFFVFELQAAFDAQRVSHKIRLALELNHMFAEYSYRMQEHVTILSIKLR